MVISDQPLLCQIYGLVDTTSVWWADIIDPEMQLPIANLINNFTFFFFIFLDLYVSLTFMVSQCWASLPDSQRGAVV